MTPKLSRLIFIDPNHTTKNVGIHLLPICYLRLTTALQVDEQSDTHAKNCCYARKCALKA
ncbi:MAG: hypothetical protein IKZ61_09600 [Prevotella sp.]|nr:hypothetical protein [Prevotella sp.]